MRRETTLNTNDLEAVRARADAAGLVLDDERLGVLAELLQEFSEMTDALKQVEIEPTNLALEPFDPAWPGGEDAR